MQTYDLSLVPTSVDVTLYKYNYIDNRLWTQIHNETDFIQNPDGSIITSTQQISAILDRHYIDIINKIKTVGSEVIYKEINSVYFLYQMVLEMENLQYIKLNLNTDKSYNRLIELDGSKILQFGFKVLTATIRLSDIYDDDELESVNAVLNKIGILKNNQNYTRVFAKDLAEAIDSHLILLEEDSENELDEDAIITDILDILEAKLEPENSLILLITDY
jgi:negative regulator of sigma E activity